MKRLLALIFLTASMAYGQSTIVSGTITDANSQPFANGTYRIEFDPNGVAPPFQWNGVPFVSNNYIFTGMLNAFGAFSGVTVPSNNFINPGTQWKFTVCPSSSSPCYAKSLVVAGATLNVSSILTPPAILVQSADYSQATAYADSEIANPKVGFKYFNLTDQKDHTCTIAIPCTWVVGPGGSGGVLSVGCENLSPLFTCFVNNATTTPDINYVLSNAAANTVFANCTSGSAAPSYCSINVAMLPVNIPNANLQNTTITVNTVPCTLGGTCTITVPSSGTAGAQYSPQYSSDGAGGHAGISPPTVNGQYACGFNVTTAVAVAPGCPLVGVSNASISGATSTFVFTYAHNAAIVTHDSAGSQIVAVTLPLSSTLGNANYITSYCNYSSHTDVISPASATINGSSTLNVTTGLCERIHPDPNSSGNWLADTSSASSGGTVTGTGSANTVTKFTASSVIGNSSVTDDGTNPTRAPNGVNTALSGNLIERTADTGGVAVNKLACRSSVNKAVICPTSTTTGVLGVAQATVSAAGTAEIFWGGLVGIIATNTFTAGHWLIPSTTVAGEVDDTGSTTEPNGTQTFLAESSGTAGQTVTTQIFSPDTVNAAGGGKPNSITVNGSNTQPITNFNGTTPAAPSTGLNVTWATSNSGNTTSAAAYIPANAIGSGTLAAQYSKGSCTELWGGSGSSFALTSGDDAISNNSCYNDSGVTRTITAVKCRSDNGSNTTTVNPTFGSAGTGTTILSGALTCGSSLAYSSTGTVSNASWTTGSGITPAMSGTLTGTSIAMIVEYTY